MKQTVHLGKIANRRFYPLLTLLTLVNLLSFSYRSPAQTIRYVSTTGTNTNPATAISWATATTSLQGAIDASAVGDQVWVAAGTYKPGGAGNTDRVASFLLKNDVQIYGGFPSNGSGTMLNRNPASYTTTLSGDIGTQGVNSDNSYNVVYVQDEVNDSAQLDGFTISGGYSGEDGVGGGGIYCEGDPAIYNCIITGNNAIRGGGIYTLDASPYLIRCIVRGNSASQGGGLYFDTDFFNGVGSPQSAPRLVDCLISDNVATVENGGGLNISGVSPILYNCTIADNQAPNGNGRAMYVQQYSMVKLVNCIVYGNGPDADNTFVLRNGSIQADYCLIQQGATRYSGANNLSTDQSPFAAQTSRDYRLNGCSSAINAGDPQSNTSTSDRIDLAGNPRFYQQGRIDIGAYEYQSEAISRLTITQQPISGTSVNVGDMATASIAVTGTDLTYQWYKNSLISAVPGQNTATLSLNNVQYSDVGSYSVVVTGLCYSLTSTAFNLDIIQAIRYVRMGATGRGYSWADASGNLQRQIDASGAQQVWVAQGTYKPTPGTDRSASFSLKNSVTIYGGFQDGGNPTLTDRNPATYLTILSGEIGNLSDPTDNSCQVIHNQNLDNTAVLDGFIITGGYANGSGDTKNLGGGIYNVNSSPRLLNCILRLNTALGNGGGMYNTNSSPTLINCLVQANNARNNGGGIYNVTFSSPQLINCLLWGNTASLGKAIDNLNYSRPSLTNCIAWNNDGNSTFLNEDGNSSLTVSFCLIEPEATNYNGSNTLTADPKFVDAVGGNFRLMAGSPAINAGSTAAYQNATGPATDLGGLPRILGGRIDLGPYELPTDLTPIISVRPSIAYNTTPLTVVVDIFEINGVASRGLITVKISNDPQVSLSLDPGTTSVNGHPVQNSAWTLSGPSSGFYTLTTTQVIAGGDVLSIGLTGVLTPGATQGTLTVSALLVGGSGGEVRFDNNNISNKINYFPQ